MTHEFYEGEDRGIPKIIVLGICLILYGATVYLLNLIFNGEFDTLIFEMVATIGCIVLRIPLGLHIYSKNATNARPIEIVSTDWVHYDDLEDEENDNTENAENFQDNE